MAPTCQLYNDYTISMMSVLLMCIADISAKAFPQNII